MNNGKKTCGHEGCGEGTLSPRRVSHSGALPCPHVLKGKRTVLCLGDAAFPPALAVLPLPPRTLYVIGSTDALQEGVAIVGARRATPYGKACAARFATVAALRNIVVISGGARGCDRAAHEATIEAGGATVAFLGGGCDRLYPPEHVGLFQRIIDHGGAVVSEHAWTHPPLPHTFRARNRLIAGLGKATLIVEAGLPSGTFSTADEALAAGKEVLAVPGAITSASSRGANRLISQGATPIVDDESFEDVLFSLFGSLKTPPNASSCALQRSDDCERFDPKELLRAALRAEPLSLDRICEIAGAWCDGEDVAVWAAERVAELEVEGMIARYPDGRYGPRA